MDSQKIGKLISKMRKNKKQTQQELANELGVSPKTISKWETGNGLPDISMLNKICKTFDISIEELLEGNLIKKENKNKKTKFIIILLIITILAIISIFLFTKRKQHITNVNYCTIIKTYYINNISKSNNENYLYVTVSEYQTEGTYTIKLPIVISHDLKVGNSYEFTLKAAEDYKNASTNILFENTEIIKIEYSDKVGLDRVSTYNCE